jgi:Raf kinase inhibitor-like YbhB/YbcL family protein
MNFQIASPAFSDGAPIPRKYTADGEQLSPELAWDGAPRETKSYALVMHDPDAPSGDFTHWLLWDIPASDTSLAEGTGSTSAGAKGNNSRGDVGYLGPSPPPGSKPHRYHFELYALDTDRLELDRGADRSQVEAAVKKHVLAGARLTGTYARTGPRR